MESPLGDFSIICFPAAPTLKKNPEQIAKELVPDLEILDYVQEASAEKGYCNVSLKWDEFASELVKEIQKESYAKIGRNKERILVEHTSANATGPFHMGRARNPIIGDSIGRLLNYSGYKVKTEYYVNDTGRQAATLAYGLENFEPAEEIKEDHKLVHCYRLASDKLKNDEETRDEIYNDMELIEKGDKKTLAKVKNAARQMMKGMKVSLRRLNAEADSYFYESDLIESGNVDGVIEKLKESKLCNDEDGAFFLDLKDEGVAGRNQKFFFTRQNGLSLYTTRDIAYHLDKFQRCDTAINILGEDHKLQGKLLGIALRELESKEPKNLFYSFVNLPGGKMSTRAGRVVYLDDIMQKIVDLSYQKLDSDFNEGENWKADTSTTKKKELAELIGIGSLRYNILKVQPEKGFTFNINDALNLQGDSAPFAMYAHARASSIIEKYTNEITLPKLIGKLETSEIELLRTLAKWPKIVEETSDNLNIHKIPNYVHKIASDFNQFYRDCPVINDKNQNFRINLVLCSQKVLHDGLGILGIKAPKVM
tara:strand:- start:2916 stop:4529 length:1614 start_codon:yes stop_codon:yes gene_type:complete